MNKSSAATSGPLLAVDFLIGCGFPLAATVLDIWWKGQPFSFAAALAAQTSQPLLWIIDSIPLLLVLWRPGPQSEAKKTGSPPRASATTEQQITERTAKLTKQIADLKAQVVHIRQEGEALRISEELHRSLVENANDSMCTLSLDGSFTAVNPGFTALLGKHRDDLMGRHCSTVLPSCSLTLIEEQIRRFQRGEKTPATLDLSFFHQNGKPIEVEARFLPTIDTEGTAMGMQSICRVKAPPPVAEVTSQHVSSSLVTATAPVSLQGSFINSTLRGASEPVLLSPSIESPVAAPALSLTSSFYQEDTTTDSLVTLLPSPSVQVSYPKPIAAASQFVFNASPIPHLSQMPAGIPSEQILDLDAALGRVDGDRELLVEMADLFLDEYPRLLSTLRDAVAQGNAPTAAYAAHTLKGSVANFAAMPAFTAAQKIERIARQGDLAQAHAAFTDLEAQLNRLKPILTNLKIEIAA
jgi:PAS domain S-box-containing protein